MNKWNLYYYPPVNEWENKAVTISDYSRIINHIQDDLGKKHIAPHVLHHLYLSLYSARKNFSEDIPDNIVTMNSEIILSTEDNNKKQIKIVFPEDVKSRMDVSVYSSLGVACLGSKVHSMICFYDDNEYKKAVIEKIVFQPEKEKLFNL